MHGGAPPAGLGRPHAGDVRLPAGGGLRQRLRLGADPEGAEAEEPLLRARLEGAQQRAALQADHPGPGVQEAGHPGQPAGEGAAGTAVRRARGAADDGAQVPEEVHRVQREDRLPDQNRGFLLPGESDNFLKRPTPMKIQLLITFSWRSPNVL